VIPEFESGNINSLPVLGFGSEEGGQVHLQSIATGRQCAILRMNADRSLSCFTFNEPHHDSNKMHANLAGKPAGQVEGVDSEDVGVEDRAPRTFDKTSVSEFPLVGDWPVLVGGSWINGEEQNKPSAGTKFAVLVSTDKSWKMVIAKVGTVFGESPSWSIEAVAKFLEAHGLFEEGRLCLPLMSPKRTVTAKGVVFIG
jgi:hypothetical protein